MMSKSGVGIALCALSANHPQQSLGLHYSLLLRAILCSWWPQISWAYSQNLHLGIIIYSWLSSKRYASSWSAEIKDHPQSDGLVERFNCTLLDMLAAAVSDRPFEWELHLRRLCHAYNTSIRPTTGFSPFFLMFSRQTRMPADIMLGTLRPLRPHFPNMSQISAPVWRVHTKMCENTWGTSRSYRRFDAIQRPKGNNSWLGTWYGFTTQQYHGESPGNFTVHGQVRTGFGQNSLMQSTTSTPQMSSEEASGAL